MITIAVVVLLAVCAYVAGCFAPAQTRIERPTEEDRDRLRWSMDND